MADKHNVKGLSHERLYNIYNLMLARCYNPKMDNYERYGGRGICVCDKWRNDYQEFRKWALSHGYADNLTIDRIDNDGNYTPENCRWATYSEQNRNRRYLRSGGYKHNWEIDGVTKSAKEWCEQYGVSIPTIMYRINTLGMTPQKALELGATGRSNKKSITTDMVLELRKQGLSKANIAKKLGCSYSTVSRKYE